MKGASTDIALVLKSEGKLVICHAQSCQTVSEMHRAIGGVVTDDLLPDDGEVRQFWADFGLAGIEIEDGTDRYIATVMRA